MKKLILFTFALVISFSMGYSQAFLNGDFESTTCPASCSWACINIPNATFTSSLSNSVGFGSQNELDIMHTSCSWGPAQSGNYFVCLAGSTGGTSYDAFSTQLTVPLVTGNTYTISYADKAYSGYDATPIEIGLSTVNNAIGTPIFTSPVPSYGIWNIRTFSFNAPNNGQFITVRAVGYRWSHVDNFQFVVPLPAMDKLQLSVQSIDKNAVIVWKLEDETDIKQYIIERSVNGSVFEEIKKIDCTYSKMYEVQDPLYYKGTALYRIALVDKDGTLHYSKVVEVHGNDEHIYFKVYPNPADNFVNVESSFDKAQIEIIDMQGKVFLVQNIGLYQSVDVSTLAPGIYTVKLTSEKGQTLYQKLFVY